MYRLFYYSTIHGYTVCFIFVWSLADDTSCIVLISPVLHGSTRCRLIDRGSRGIREFIHATRVLTVYVIWLLYLNLSYRNWSMHQQYITYTTKTKGNSNSMNNNWCLIRKNVFFFRNSSQSRQKLYSYNSYRTDTCSCNIFQRQLQKWNV